jgi:uracil phosphoribosyltransferase
MTHELGKENSIFNQFLREVRDENIHTDRARFRRNMERLGEIFAYELSKSLTYKTEDVVTPLGTAVMQVLDEQPILATILRAGLPLHQGLLNFFNEADSAFVSAYRKHSIKDEDEFTVEVEYMSSPSIEGKQLVIADPMLATGSSMVLSHKALLRKGNPAHTHIVALLATREGINYCRKHMPKNTTYWIGVIDDELTAASYIVPGLGDAGDLSYGSK